MSKVIELRVTKTELEQLLMGVGNVVNVLMRGNKNKTTLIIIIL